MILSERHIIKKNNSLYGELDNLCFLSKNIYNSALYAIRQYYFENKKYLSWVNVNNNFVRVSKLITMLFLARLHSRR